jgi:hypothetical protein
VKFVAARRLIAILLVLLFLSSLAAALAPVQDGRKLVSSTSSTETTTAEAPALPASDASSDARLISQSVDARNRRAAPIRARTGDQLQLRVTSDTPGTVELVGLGAAEDVGPKQPAYFDVLLRTDGTYPIRFFGADEDIARIEVSLPAASTALR